MEIKRYLKYSILPLERFKNTKNPSLYKIRFIETANKLYQLKDDRLYYKIKIRGEIKEDNQNNDK